jgi:hypothetical protein
MALQGTESITPSPNVAASRGVPARVRPDRGGELGARLWVAREAEQHLMARCGEEPAGIAAAVARPDDPDLHVRFSLVERR